MSDRKEKKKTDMCYQVVLNKMSTYFTVRWCDINRKKHIINFQKLHLCKVVWHREHEEKNYFFNTRSSTSYAKVYVR